MRKKKKKLIEIIEKWEWEKLLFFLFPIISYKMKNVSIFFRTRNRKRYQTPLFQKNKNINRKQETRMLPSGHLAILNVQLSKHKKWLT